MKSEETVIDIMLKAVASIIDCLGVTPEQAVDMVLAGYRQALLKSLAKK